MTDKVLRAVGAASINPLSGAPMKITTLAALLFLCAATPAITQTQPMPLPSATPIEAPKDIPYPGGTVRLSVDATDLAHHIFRAHETIPVAKPGAVKKLPRRRHEVAR